MSINSNPPEATLLYHYDDRHTRAGRTTRGPFVYAIYEVEVLPAQFTNPAEAIKANIPGLPKFGDLWEEGGEFAVPCSGVSVLKPLGPTRFIAEATFGYNTLGGGGPARNYKTTISDRKERFILPRYQQSTENPNVWTPAFIDFHRFFINTTFYGTLPQNQINLAASETRTYTGQIRNIGGFWHVFLGADVWTDAQNVTRYAAKFETSSYIKERTYQTATLTPLPALLPLEEYDVRLPEGVTPPQISVTPPEDQYEIIPGNNLQWITDL